MRIKDFFAIGTLLICLPFFFLYAYKNYRAVSNSFRASSEHFDSANINGKLTRTENCGYATSFRVRSAAGEEYYNAAIFLTGENSGKSFINFAHEGDGIIKKPFADSLILMQDNVAYYCKWARHIK